MSNFEVVHIGPPSEWRNFFGGFRPESSRQGRRVVDHELDSQYIGLTVNALAPGEQAGYWHSHSVIEELYVFLEGDGQMALDDALIEVSSGAVVRVGPGVNRTWRASPSSEGELRWLCIRSGGGALSKLPDDAVRDESTPMPW